MTLIVMGYLIAIWCHTGVPYYYQVSEGVPSMVTLLELLLVSVQLVELL